MKFIITSLLILLLSINVGLGQTRLPDSYVNLGLGLGMNYGIIGTKTVIGYRNSGLMLGLGFVPGGLLGYEIGAQISYEWFYANIGYGVFGTQKINDDPTESLKAGDIMVGAMIDLGRAKTVFIDIGLGHTFGAPTMTGFLGNTIDQNAFNGVLGLGFRLGTKKR